jgi:hypothetical protein
MRVRFRLLVVLACPLLIAIGERLTEALVLAGESRKRTAPAGAKIDQKAFAQLKSHIGKNLRELDEKKKEELLGVIQRLIPKRKYRDQFDFTPWSVCAFTKPGGDSAALLFDVNNTLPHPGCTLIRLTLFDASGKVLSEMEFGTGHRCYLYSAALKQLGKDEYPVLLLKTEIGAGPGPDIAKQYYARIGGRFDLVRLEGSGGKATRNDYYGKGFACGPAVPKQTEAQWEADLLSPKRMRVLRALVWLGGAHSNAKPGEKLGRQAEDLEQVQLVRRTREREKVVIRLRELSKSADQWLREGAKLALDPKDTRF